MAPIRSEQIGSLIRPDKLHDARDAYHAGRLSLADLRQAEDAAILDALAWQKQIGIDVFTDGEMRRDAWQTNIMQAVEGFEPDYPVREMEVEGRKVSIELHSKAVVSKLRKVRRIVETDALFLKQHSPGPYKITMPSPSMVARSGFVPGRTQDYATFEDLQADLASIIRDEMVELVSEGVTYIQLDEGFTNFATERAVQEMRDRAIDPEKAIMDQIAVENSCYDAVRRPDITLAAHVCRGSRTNAKKNLLDPVRTTHDFDFLAQHVFPNLHVDRFLFEFDSDFAALRHLPKDKVLVLGLVSSVEGSMETRDDVMRCIEAASKYCSLEQLAISTQCGFSGSGTRDGAHMSANNQRRKLELVAGVAREVWG
jgi:5-methyltetrahydropteroyltriglutamate--homocysteine methyltransferase